MLLYTGLAWCADAMEMMLLSFLGPAVSLLHTDPWQASGFRFLCQLCTRNPV